MLNWTMLSALEARSVGAKRVGFRQWRRVYHQKMNPTGRSKHVTFVTEPLVRLQFAPPSRSENSEAQRWINETPRGPKKLAHYKNNSRLSGEPINAPIGNEEDEIMTTPKVLPTRSQIIVDSPHHWFQDSSLSSTTYLGILISVVSDQDLTPLAKRSLDYSSADLLV